MSNAVRIIMVRADINPRHWPLLSTNWPLVLNSGWYNWPMEVNIRMEIHGPHFIANPEVWLRQGRGTIKCEVPCDLKTALEKTKYCITYCINQLSLFNSKWRGVLTFHVNACHKCKTPPNWLTKYYLLDIIVRPEN